MSGSLYITILGRFGFTISNKLIAQKLVRAYDSFHWMLGLFMKITLSHLSKAFLLGLDNEGQEDAALYPVANGHQSFSREIKATVSCGNTSSAHVILVKMQKKKKNL